jgi:hypothetical protein
METGVTTERLHRDHFPVEVYAPHLVDAPRAGRVFITNQRIQLWIDSAGVPKLAMDERVLEEVERDRGSLFGQIKVETVGGPVYVTKGRGCGCHSPLKALSPPVSW